ncbi:MAG: VTT domain-containing protein [Candidatus Promineifilaceae bacterium]
MQSFIEFIQTFWINLQNGHLPQLGYWNYFILSFLIILQGPAATLLGGAAANAGLLRPQFVFLAGISGNLLADIFWYNIGSRGKTEWILKHGQRFGIGQRHVDKLSESMEQHAVKILLMAKISVGLAVPTLLVAGIIRLPWRKWFPVVFVGEVIWTGFLVLVGYYATEAIKQMEQGIHALLLGVTFLLLVAVVWFVPRMLHHE